MNDRFQSVTSLDFSPAIFPCSTHGKEHERGNTVFFLISSPFCPRTAEEREGGRSTEPFVSIQPPFLPSFQPPPPPSRLIGQCVTPSRSHEVGQLVVTCKRHCLDLIERVAICIYLMLLPQCDITFSWLFPQGVSRGERRGIKGKKGFFEGKKRLFHARGNCSSLEGGLPLGEKVFGEKRWEEAFMKFHTPGRYHLCTREGGGAKYFFCT